jgi:plasmid maintenance system antidote protein VapI
MRHATALFAVVAISSLASAETGKAPPPKLPAPTTPAALSESSKMLEPIQVESLTLTPIVTTKQKIEDETLIVLDEAMGKKLVRIHEVDDEDVNNLKLTNKSDQPLFLLAGEVIIGGKQDRIIGRNTIIPPKKTLTVPVFCVEHGRWDNSGKEFTTAKALAHGRLRGSANFDTQTDVWKEVAAKNELRKTKSSTDTYRKVATQQSDGTLKTWEKQVDTALGKLTDADKAKLVGFAVSVNGKVATVDVFENPTLFKKLQGKLVRSYITEAIDVKKQKDIKAPTATDVKDFIADAEKAQEEAAYETELADTRMKKGGKAAKARVMYKAAKGAGKDNPAAPAAEAKPVFESYQAR